MTKSMRLALFALAVSAGGVSSSDAAVLATDNFESYTTGASLNGLNGGTGWSGGYAVGATGQGYLNQVRDASPLSYPNYETGGGKYANLASGFGGPAFNYFQRGVAVTGAFADYNDGTRVGKDGTTLWGSFLYHEANRAQFLLQGTTNKTFELPSTGSNSLFLFRIDFGTADADTIRIYNNPDLTTFDENATVPTSTAFGDYSFQSIGFIAPTDQNEARFDNIVLGTSVGDVVPVPEPTGLAAIGLVAAVGLRRRQ